MSPVVLYCSIGGAYKILIMHEGRILTRVRGYSDKPAEKVAVLAERAAKLFARHYHASLIYDKLGEQDLMEN